MKNKRKLLSILSLLIILSSISGCTLSKEAMIKGVELVDTPLMTNMYDGVDMNEMGVNTKLNRYSIERVQINTGWSMKAKEFYLREHPYGFGAFIDNANIHNIEIESYLENPNWALKENFKSLKEEVLHVISFNKKYKVGFKAINLNIDFHTLSSWVNGNDKEKEGILLSLIENLKEIKKIVDLHNKNSKDNLKLNISFPYCYNDKAFNVHDENIIDLVMDISDGVNIRYDIKDKELTVKAVELLKSGDKKGKNVLIDLSLNEDYLYSLSPNDLVLILSEAVNEFKSFKSFKGLNMGGVNPYKAYIENM